MRRLSQQWLGESLWSAIGIDEAAQRWAEEARLWMKGSDMLCVVRRWIYMHWKEQDGCCSSWDLTFGGLGQEQVGVI